MELNLVSAKAALTVCEDLPERLLSRNDGKRVDAALICTTRQGAPLALRHALTVVKSGGCIDLTTNFPESGTAPEGLDTVSLRAVRAANVCGSPREGAYLHWEKLGRRITLTGHRGTSAGHMNAAMLELSARAASYRKLITHVMTLRDAASAITALANSGERVLNAQDCIKAVIDLSAPPSGPLDDRGCGCASKSR
jgi:threonine dehydrogenase-like Zn-dependent dehydrogenase